jgi:hypothetical protein
VNAAPESGASEIRNSALLSRSEVIGHWRMVQLPEETRQKINKIDPWPQPYQWFAFYDDGRHNFAFSSKDMTVADLEAVFAMGENSRFEYLEEHRVYRITQPDGISLYMTISVCRRPLNLVNSRFETGDLLMAILDNKGQRVHHRQLRRM